MGAQVDEHRLPVGPRVDEAASERSQVGALPENAVEQEERVLGNGSRRRGDELEVKTHTRSLSPEHLPRNRDERAEAWSRESTDRRPDSQHRTVGPCHRERLSRHVSFGTVKASSADWLWRREGGRGDESALRQTPNRERPAITRLVGEVRPPQRWQR